jgi:transposase-like protein
VKVFKVVLQTYHVTPSATPIHTTTLFDIVNFWFCCKPQTELRQVKYINNLIEQDHRLIQGLVKLELGFQSFYAIMNTIRKG